MEWLGVLLYLFHSLDDLLFKDLLSLLHLIQQCLITCSFALPLFGWLCWLLPHLGVILHTLIFFILLETVIGLNQFECWLSILLASPSLARLCMDINSFIIFHLTFFKNELLLLMHIHILLLLLLLLRYSSILILLTSLIRLMLILIESQVKFKGLQGGIRNTSCCVIFAAKKSLAASRSVWMDQLLESLRWGIRVLLDSLWL